MKTLIIIFAWLCVSSAGFGQNLSDLYKKEQISLEPVPGYAQSNNWNELFADYNAKGYEKPIGQMKEIAIAPDGSIFMSHKTRYEIWKFDKTGKFVKKFGGKGSKPGQFIMLPSVEGILDGKYVFTTDVQGRMLFFDLEGNFIKSFKLDYMPLGMTPLKGGKIAILGWVAWKGEQSKQILRIKDFATGSEKEILSDFEPYLKNGAVIKIPKGGMLSCAMPYTSSSLRNFRMGTSRNGNLILASPKDGKITEYSPEGKVLSTFQVNIEPLKITDSDIKQYYENALKMANDFLKGHMAEKLTDQEKADLLKDYKQQLEKYKDRSLYPAHLPYFSSIIVDSDGNLLVFEFTKDDATVTNHFKAYSYTMKGNFLGSSSFKNDLLDMNFTPRTFQFQDGYVYVIANIKNAKKSECPLRIAKLKPVL